MKLDPGTYVMECYVKAPDGTFHASLGMARSILVRREPSRGSPPTADVDVTLSNDEIAGPEAVTPGEHTVAVHYQEHPQGGLGNDLHLVRLGQETSLEEIASWMDWMEVGGLRAPAPAEFLGGAQEMPVGYTAYFTVDVEPGRYAWISESPAEGGMVRVVTVE